MDPQAIASLKIRHLRDGQCFAGTLYTDVHLGSNEIKRDVLRRSADRGQEHGH
jgi:hypothetical protein